MRKVLFIVSLIAAFSSASHAGQPKTYFHPKLRSKEGRTIGIRRVIVLPPKVQVSRVGIKGEEEMLEDSGSLGLRIAGIVSAALASREITVDESPFTERTLRGDSELHYTLADLQRRYDLTVHMLHSYPKDVSIARFSLGDDVSKLFSDPAPDAVVFIRAAGVIRKFGPLTSGITCSVSVVHSGSGDILLLVMFEGDDKFLSNPEKSLGPNIRWAFRLLGSGGGM